MMEVLRHVFSYVCGQVHLWAPAGNPLAMCERCTGLYVGGAYAAVVIAFFLVRPTARVLWAHGIAMLIMVPFGYHLVRQSAMVRTITGQVFAYGLVYYLLLTPGERWGFWRERNARWMTAYILCLAAGVPLLLMDLKFGSALDAELLSVIGGIGLLIYFVLIVANLCLFASYAWQLRRAEKVV